MSNNLACYPLLRKGRNVDILIAFDSSAEIQNANWIGLAEGYARQRKITGWPVCIGWPQESLNSSELQLDNAQAISEAGAIRGLSSAKEADIAAKEMQNIQAQDPTTGAKGLGYCTIWAGTKQLRDSDGEPPPSKALDDEWELMRPDAGITVAYFPLIPNEKVPGVDPDISPYLSTWNFEVCESFVNSQYEILARLLLRDNMLTTLISL